MIEYIGVNDHNIDLFEGQYKVKNGMSYNSYFINDLKTAVLDTVDKNFKEEWLRNIENKLNGKEPDYLVIHHMEPDHSANIKVFMEKYKNTKIVSSVGAFNMMKNLFKTDFSDRKIVVKENDKLELGNHVLNFIQAPLVHWPEVMFSYDSYEGVLFSADGFGKFGALDINEPWDDEARRYYIGIVGKFGVNVQNVLKKASSLDIKKIAPLHGPILDNNLNHYLSLYDKWSSYTPEENGTVIAYNSIYGNTEYLVKYLYECLKELGKKAVLYDLARTDMSYALADAYRYDTLVLATPTYNGDVFPFMKTFINTLIDHNFQNRNVLLIENGMWAPSANKVIKNSFANLKNINYINELTIKGSVTEDMLNTIKEIAKSL